MPLRITFSHSRTMPIALVIDFAEADGTVNFESVRDAHEFAKKIARPQTRIEVDYRLAMPVTGGPYDSRIEKIKEAALAGRKIDAIKEYRILTGVGLKESKDAIEDMIATNNWYFRHPVTVILQGVG